MFKLVSFKLVSDFIRFAIKAKYVWALWLILCLSGFIIFLRFQVDIAVDLMVISLALFLVTIADRFVYKKITSYVIMNRFKKTLHMNLPERLPKRHQLESIVLELKEALKKESRKSTRYYMKTHQRILDQLLNDTFQESISVDYESTGTGVIYEKVVMVSYSRILKNKDRKIRTLFLLAQENKYDVQLRIK